MNNRKSIAITLLLWSTLPCLAQTAGTPRPPDATRDSAFHFADSVFARAAFVFETLQPDIPADMQPILIRMNNAIVANKEWFIEYRNKYAAAGQGPLPYNERFGITRDEYRKVQHLESQPPQLVVVDSQQVTVQDDHGLLQFKTEGSTHLLDYLLIDIQHQLLMYGGDTLPFGGAVSTKPTHPYGQWQGYTWRLERTDLAASLETSKPTARVIQVDLGLPTQPNLPAQPSPSTKPNSSAQPNHPTKTYIHIEYQDMKAGITTANLELIGYIR